MTSSTQTYIPRLGTATLRRATSLRDAVRTRRAGRSSVSREIAAYPATRGVAVVVLPDPR